MAALPASVLLTVPTSRNLKTLRHPVTLLAAGACFCLGLLFPGMGVGEQQLARLQGGLPETVVAPRRAAGDPPAERLDAWNVYHQVLGELKERYYGELPDELRLTYAAIRGMLRPVDDPFTRFMDPEEYAEQNDENVGEFVGIGAYLEEKPAPDGYVPIHRALPGGPAAKAGIKAKDAIVKVNGRSVQGYTTEKLVETLRGAPGTAVQVTVRRPGSARLNTHRLVRARVEYEVVESEMKPSKLGYVRLTVFNQHADGQMTRAIRQLEKQGMRGLILDLRGNPGGMLDAATHVVSRFLPAGNTAVLIVGSGGQRAETKVDPRRFLNLRVPLVVLVDGESASAAEIVAGAIQDHHLGTVIGEQTYGKGLVQSVIELPGKAAVAITSEKYLTSKGNDINRSATGRGGIKPDVEALLSDRDAFSGNDTQLSRAVQFLQQKLASRTAS